MYDSGHEIVDTVGKLNFEGNVIPNTWYQTLRKENGKPDINAMILLSDFVYWHRPTITRDEDTGLIKEVKKKFKSDLLQRSYKQIEEQFGLTMKQAKETLVRLENQNVIKRVFRTVDTPQGRLPNIMFIELNVKGLIQITFPKSTDVCTKKDVYPSKKVRTPVHESTDITEITTEITTEREVVVEEAPEKINPFSFFEQNGFGAISPYMSQKIDAWSNDLSDELVIEAMKIAIESSTKNWKYVEAILRDWVDKGYKTVEEVRAAQLAYKEQRSKPQGQSKPSKQRGNPKSREKLAVEDIIQIGVSAKKSNEKIIEDVLRAYKSMTVEDINKLINKTIVKNKQAEEKSKDWGNKFDQLLADMKKRNG